MGFGFRKRSCSSRWPAPYGINEGDWERPSQEEHFCPTRFRPIHAQLGFLSNSGWSAEEWRKRIARCLCWLSTCPWVFYSHYICASLTNIFLKWLIRYQVKPDQAHCALNRFEIKDTIVTNTCPTFPVCDKKALASPYRTITGICNHVHYPGEIPWGVANSQYRRLLTPDYADGIFKILSNFFFDKNVNSISIYLFNISFQVILCLNGL